MMGAPMSDLDFLRPQYPFLFFYEVECGAANWHFEPCAGTTMYCLEGTLSVRMP